MALLATLTATPATVSAVLRTFSEALDAEEEPEAEVPDSVPGAEDAAMTRPCPHFLSRKKGVSATQLESPHIAGIRTPLHAILSLLSPAEHGTPTTTLASCPHLVTASYRLLFTLISSPVTSEPVLRYLRSSSYLAAQLATLGPLLTAPPGSCGPAVAQLRAASWLLRCVAVEVRVVAASRQHSQLATLLGLLLDRCEADTEAAATSLYQDTTFSQLSRTVTATTTRQLTDSPASSHRLALVLGCIEFESGSMVSPGWDLFDESQVAGVLEQCQVANMDGGSGEPLVYRIMAVELATIQGSAAVNQRAMIQSEIESILHYAVSWNSAQENAAARRDLLDSWRQVAETLLTLAPAELLPAASKQQILLQLLQTLLNKVAGESLVSGMDSLVSSTVLLLMTALRQTYTAAPDKQDIMGDTFVGLLDTQAAGDSSGQLYSASLQVILKGLIRWTLSAGAGSQVIRTNLYASLLAFLRIGKAEAGDGAAGKVLEISERGKLQKANLEVVLSYGTSLLEVLARDATTGHEVRRMLALAVLDELTILDRQAATIRFLANHGFLKHLIETLLADEEGLVELLTKPGSNIRSMYVYESKINLMIRVACNPVGAELLLQAGLMARLAEFSVLDLRPDPDTNILRGGESEAGDGGLSKYHSVLFPVLRLCQAVLASLGSDNLSAASQVVHFLAGHEELVSLVLRGSAARSSLHPALLQELALMTSVVSRASTLDLKQDSVMDASTIELQGQLSRIQKQMMSLLHQFQLTDSLMSGLQSSNQAQASMLYVLQIVSNAASFAKTLVVSAGLNPRSTR